MDDEKLLTNIKKRRHGSLEKLIDIYIYILLMSA